MKRTHQYKRWLAIASLAALLAGCGTVPIKKYYVLSYVPSPPQTRLNEAPYPFTIRLKEFSIEDAYARPQIVYRQNAYELEYYFYKVWAVKPAQMITDLIYKHLATANIISAIVRRYDEGARPNFELSGMIEALDEYDSDKVWFAHMALRFQLVRISDGRVIYSRRFDNRKRVNQNDPKSVIEDMSRIMEFIMNQVVHDMDVVLSREYGISGGGMQLSPANEDSIAEVPEDSAK